MLRLSRLFILPAAAGLLFIGSSVASAGEINGNGQPPGGEGLGAAHAHSICVFSGLEDGSEGGPAGPGTTQNWGQIPKAIRDIIATQGEHPGDACNGHTGFLAGGGGE